MGRYTSYGIATIYVIPLKDLEAAISKKLYGKTLADVNEEDLRKIYPKDVYDIAADDTNLIIVLKDRYTGTDIYSLLKDFASITPYKRQLSPDIIEEIGALIKEKPVHEVLDLAEEKQFEGFQLLDLPPYCYWTKVPIGDKSVYVRTLVRGLLIGYSYAKTITEDDSDPYEFLTELLRYRLKENPLAPTLFSFLSV